MLCSNAIHIYIELNLPSSPFSSPHPLTSPDSRARRRIARRHRVVDVDLDTLVRGAVRTRESNRGSRGATSSILDLDLRTRDVELRTAYTTSRVQGNVLDAQKVLARRERLGDREGDFCGAVVGKGHLAAGEGGALGVDLEPDVAGAVECRGSLARWDLGHVELEGARVRDGCHGSESDIVTSIDSVRLGCCAGGELVATNLRRRDVGYGAVGLVVRCLYSKSVRKLSSTTRMMFYLADILPLPSCCTSSNELGEGVVSAGRAGDSKKRKNGRLHDDPKTSLLTE
jgi:hypothetical protein